MKKFMWLIVTLVALTGCASSGSRDRNPHYRNALETTGTIASGLAVFNSTGSYGLAIAGAVVGNQIMKGILWEPPADPEYVVVGGQAQGQSGSGYVVGYKRPNAKKKERRLTIENYQAVNDEGLGPVPEDCRTGNWGMDASCLRDYSEKLDKGQAECVKKKMTKDPFCLKRPGVLAGEYAILADDLDKLEKRARGGMTYDRLTGLSR